MSKHVYTVKQIEFLKEASKTNTRCEVVRMFNEEFNTNLSGHAIDQIRSKNKIKIVLNKKINTKEYALYRGDELLSFGTIHDIAEELGLRVNTVVFYKTPSWLKCSSEDARRLIEI